MTKINWLHLESEEQLNQVLENSENKTQLIFKYSSRCSLSDMMLSRFESKWDNEQAGHIAPVFLDLIQYRPVSNAIEAQLNVLHESPQVLVVKGGKCTYHTSHMRIDYETVLENS